MEGPNPPEGSSGTRPAVGPAAARLVVHARQLTGGATLLRVIGVIDRGTAPLLERRLIAAARRCPLRPPRLLLELGGVTFLDHAGLDTLLRTQTRLTNAFGTLELVEPTPGVIRLLHQANLDGASWTPPTD